MRAEMRNRPVTTASVRDVHAVPVADAVPGLVLRHYRAEPADHAAMASVVNERYTAGGMIASSTADDIANTYRHLVNCDPERDIALVELHGRVVGYARVFWEDLTAGDRAFFLVGSMHPDHDGDRIAQVTHRWQEQRIADVLASMQQLERRAVAMATVLGQEPGRRRMVEAAGYELVRRHAEMRRPDFEGVPDLPLPEGLEIRPIDPADRAMHRRIYEADMEAFQDHWGATRPTEEGFGEFIGQPTFDPTLWRVAFDGDQIAGQILNLLGALEPDGSRVGWTESISTRRPWRRRGLARALLAESLRTVRDAGATSAALGVDQQNPHQALHLYESLGFRLSAEEFEYRKVLRPARTSG
jgi:ribosomal protein S18 acetylase RimI-like enzyme